MSRQPVAGLLSLTLRKRNPKKGEVIAVGQGRLLDNGDRQPIDVAVEDKILFGKYSGTEVTYDNEELLILREDDILAKIS
ncbi:10 kDa chaperonin [Geodia barretti]|uniref:20 kDa chaperonin, chloroplastic n=1 Tax=Geodia barretti TaxID=519541 RepID=A0AA35T711_GEOBA|nr:10 kDa chaperonin [Geodia barretti]